MLKEVTLERMVLDIQALAIVNDDRKPDEDGFGSLMVGEVQLDYRFIGSAFRVMFLPDGGLRRSVQMWIRGGRVSITEYDLRQDKTEPVKADLELPLAKLAAEASCLIRGEHRE